jgi:hypothetical protein
MPILMKKFLTLIFLFFFFSFFEKLFMGALSPLEGKEEEGS